jgi:hypothetical protein
MLMEKNTEVKKKADDFYSSLLQKEFQYWSGNFSLPEEKRSKSLPIQIRQACDKYFDQAVVDIEPKTTWDQLNAFFLKEPRTMDSTTFWILYLQLLFLYDSHFYPPDHYDNVGICWAYSLIRYTQLWKSFDLLRDFLTNAGLKINNCANFLKAVETSKEFGIQPITHSLTKEDILVLLHKKIVPVELPRNFKIADDLLMPPALYVLHDMKHAVDFVYGSCFLLQKMDAPTQIVMMDKKISISSQQFAVDTLRDINGLWFEQWSRLLVEAQGEKRKEDKEKCIDALFYMVHELLLPSFNKVVDLCCDFKSSPLYVRENKVSTFFLSWAKPLIRRWYDPKVILMRCNPLCFMKLGYKLIPSLEWMFVKPHSYDHVILEVDVWEGLIGDRTPDPKYILHFIDLVCGSHFEQITVEKEDWTKSVYRMSGFFLPALHCRNWKTEYLSAFITEFDEDKKELNVNILTWNKNLQPANLLTCEKKDCISQMSFSCTKNKTVNTEEDLYANLEKRVLTMNSVTAGFRLRPIFWALHKQPFDIDALVALYKPFQEGSIFQLCSNSSQIICLDVLEPGLFKSFCEWVYL